MISYRYDRFQLSILSILIINITDTICISYCYYRSQKYRYPWLKEKAPKYNEVYSWQTQQTQEWKHSLKVKHSRKSLATFALSHFTIPL